MQPHGSKYLACRRPYPPPLPQFGMRSIGLYSFILAHGQAAYQIKGNHEMQQHGSKYFAHGRLTNPSPLTPGLESVGKNST